MTVQRQESYGRRFNAVFSGRIALIAALSVLAPLAEATTSERVVVNRFSGLAIEGFDPMAYFVTGQALRGLPEFEASQGGVVWRFHNEGNRASCRPPGRLWSTVRRLRSDRHRARRRICRQSAVLGSVGRPALPVRSRGQSRRVCRQSRAVPGPGKGSLAGSRGNPRPIGCY